MTLPISQDLNLVLSAIRHAGGKPILVGGCVRDYLLDGSDPKDIDIEVFGLGAGELAAALGCFKVDAVGASFGVLKVGVGHQTFDVSLPRRESKQGTGHRGFVTTPDPSMSFAEAVQRRDLTINAIGYDPQTGEFLDPAGGQRDLVAKVLRHVGPAFREDPLRVLRVCQFAARLGFRIHEQTVEECQLLTEELKTLPVERVWEEFKKLLVRGKKPSLGLAAMRRTGALSLFPELSDLLYVPQDPAWHPEGQGHPLGSLWIHTAMVTDQAVRVCDDDQVDDEERLVVMLGALCHDLGKPSTTQVIDGRVRSLAHEEAGVEPTRSFLTRIGAPPAVVEAVVPLVAHHLKPFHLARDRASNSAIRRLSLKAPLTRLCRVARADYLGRTTEEALATQDSRQIPDILWLLERAQGLRVESQGPKPLLMGRHLMGLGVLPGPQMGVVLKAAFEAQLDDAFTDEPGAVLWAEAYLSPGIEA